MGREMLNHWDISRLAEANGYAGPDAMAAGDALADAVAHAADGSATAALTTRLKTMHTKPAAVADVIGKCPQTVRKWISEADARLVETAGRNCRAAALCVALAALGGGAVFDRTPMGEARALGELMPRDPAKEKTAAERRADLIDVIGAHCAKMPLDSLAALAAVAAALDNR